MWSWVEAVLSYSEMMKLLIKDGVAFTDEAKASLVQQTVIQKAIRDRFTATGLVCFYSNELESARAATFVMDQLISMDRHGIAWAAREYGRVQTEKLKVNKPIQH